MSNDGLIASIHTALSGESPAKHTLYSIDNEINPLVAERIKSLTGINAKHAMKVPPRAIKKSAHMMDWFLTEFKSFFTGAIKKGLSSAPATANAPATNINLADEYGQQFHETATKNKTEKNRLHQQYKSFSEGYSSITQRSRHVLNHLDHLSATLSKTYLSPSAPPIPSPELEGSVDSKPAALFRHDLEGPVASRPAAQFRHDLEGPVDSRPAAQFRHDLEGPVDSRPAAQFRHDLEGPVDSSLAPLFRTDLEAPIDSEPSIETTPSATANKTKAQSVKRNTYPHTSFNDPEAKRIKSNNYPASKPMAPSHQLYPVEQSTNPQFDIANPIDYSGDFDTILPVLIQNIQQVSWGLHKFFKEIMIIYQSCLISYNKLTQCFETSISEYSVIASEFLSTIENDDEEDDKKLEKIKQEIQLALDIDTNADAFSNFTENKFIPKLALALICLQKKQEEQQSHTNKFSYRSNLLGSSLSESLPSLRKDISDLKEKSHDYLSQNTNQPLTKVLGTLFQTEDILDLTEQTCRDLCRAQAPVKTNAFSGIGAFLSSLIPNTKQRK